MRVEQYHSPTSGGLPFARDFRPDLILVVGDKVELERDSKAAIRSLQSIYPVANIVGCSTGKFIVGAEIFESGIGVTGIQLSEGQFDCFAIEPAANFIFEARRIGQQINAGDHQNGALLLCDTDPEKPEEILAGLSAELGDQYPVTGAVASSDSKADGQTAVYLGEKEVAAVIVSFNSSELCLTSDSTCGLDEHGRIHQVTESNGAVIRQIEGRRALDVFHEHIGDDFEHLPLSARHYPFQLISADGQPGVIRCPIGFDYEEGTITCAGRVPKGPLRLLTFTDHEKLVDAGKTASRFLESVSSPKLHFFFSCSARLAVVGPLYELEFDRMLENTGDDAKIFGFYANGEIGSFYNFGKNQLHNMTVAVSALSEVGAPIAKVELSS